MAWISQVPAAQRVVVLDYTHRVDVRQILSKEKKKVYYYTHCPRLEMSKIGGAAARDDDDDVKSAEFNFLAKRICLVFPRKKKIEWWSSDACAKKLLVNVASYCGKQQGFFSNSLWSPRLCVVPHWILLPTSIKMQLVNFFWEADERYDDEQALY